jgi:hypothetical protein
MFAFSTRIRFSDYVGSSQGLARLSSPLFKLGSRYEPSNKIHGASHGFISLISLTLGLVFITYV